MTEERLRQLVENLRRFEGDIPWPYKDNSEDRTPGYPLVTGYVTAGMGIMLPSVSAALALPFHNMATGAVATEEEIGEAYNRVAAMSGGRGPSFYKQQPPIELLPEDVVALAERKLTKWAIPVIEASLRGHDLGPFDGLPWGAQQVLADIQWNVKGGVAGFPSMLGAMANGDCKRAAAESHVATCRAARNTWRAETLLSCAAPALA